MLPFSPECVFEPAVEDSDRFRISHQGGRFHRCMDDGDNRVRRGLVIPCKLPECVGVLGCSDFTRSQHINWPLQWSSAGHLANCWCHP